MFRNANRDRQNMNQLQLSQSTIGSKQSSFLKFSSQPRIIPDGNDELPLTWKVCTSLVCDGTVWLHFCKVFYHFRRIVIQSLNYMLVIMINVNVLLYFFNHKKLIWAILSLCILLTHRVTLGYIVASTTSRYTKRLFRYGAGILQFLELYILFESFQSFEKRAESSRFLRLRYVLVAAQILPQLLVQSVYLVENYTNMESSVVVVSLSVNLLSSIGRVVRNDMVCVFIVCHQIDFMVFYLCRVLFPL